MTLPNDIIEQAAAMLRKGHSQRKTAKALNISRGTVNAIAKGNRQVNRRQLEQDIDERSYGTGPLHRCKCGLLIRGDCLRCALTSFGCD